MKAHVDLYLDMKIKIFWEHVTPFFFFFYLIKAHFIASLLQLCPAEMCKSEESKGKYMFILLTESHGKTKEDFLWQVISSMNHPFYCWGRMKI